MRRRSDDCLSDLQLDRALAGELTPNEQRAITAHVDHCDGCRQRNAELAQARQRFAGEAPPFAALDPAAPSPLQRDPDAASHSEPFGSSRRGLARPARSPRPHWLVGASALAAAAAIGLAVGRPWQRERAEPGTDSGHEAPTSVSRGGEGSGMRSKGGLASLGWVVRRNGRVFVGRSDEPVHTGDALRFTISAREPVYVAILGLDAAGKLSVYHPEGERLAKIEAGRDQVLSTAIEWDATDGEEQLYGVFCSGDTALALVRNAIERSPEAPALPAGCSLERSTLNGEPP